MYVPISVRIASDSLNREYVAAVVKELDGVEKKVCVWKPSIKGEIKLEKARGCCSRNNNSRCLELQGDVQECHLDDKQNSHHGTWTEISSNVQKGTVSFTTKELEADFATRRRQAYESKFINSSCLASNAQRVSFLATSPLQLPSGCASAFFGSLQTLKFHCLLSPVFLSFLSLMMSDLRADGSLAHDPNTLVYKKATYYRNGPFFSRTAIFESQEAGVDDLRASEQARIQTSSAPPSAIKIYKGMLLIGDEEGKVHSHSVCNGSEQCPDLRA